MLSQEATAKASPHGHSYWGAQMRSGMDSGFGAGSVGIGIGIGIDTVASLVGVGVSSAGSGVAIPSLAMP